MTETTTDTLWWVYVTFGPCELPEECLTPTQDRAALVAAYEQALYELATEGGPRAWTEQHSWLHGYRTREQAACGDCSYGRRTHGRMA